jgi:hypothetical protein
VKELWRAYEEDGAAGAPHEVEKRAKVAPVLHEAPLRLIPAPETENKAELHGNNPGEFHGDGKLAHKAT